MIAPPVRLFLVDDHTLFREGLARLLATDPTVELVGSTSIPRDAIPQITAARIDVVIVDYDLGSETAVSFVQRLRQLSFAGKVMLVTAGVPDRDALELLRLGVAGIVHKHQSPSELQQGILEVARGKMVVDAVYMQSLLDTAVQPPAHAPVFSEREQDILRLLLEGASNKEMASTLGTSESAVKASLQGLFGKTGVRTRGQLVRVVLEQFRDRV